jgi:hypothetical protein
MMSSTLFAPRHAATNASEVKRSPKMVKPRTTRVRTQLDPENSLPTGSEKEAMQPLSTRLEERKRRSSQRENE